MPTYTGTAANNTWTVVNPGTFTLDGLGGTDTLALGTSLRSAYKITLSSDGAVHVDSVSGASQQLHATLYNMEVLTFNSGRDVLDLTTYFGDKVAPTVTISDNVPGIANGNVTYTLSFSEAVVGLTAADFQVNNGSVVSVAGSGSTWTVVVAPRNASEGTLGLTLLAAGVADAAGNANATATADPQAIDTLAPTLASTSPGNATAGVALGAKLDFTFSETIQKGAGSIVVSATDGSVLASYDIASSANVSVSGRTLTLDPASDLPASSTLRVTLSAGAVKDAAGNALATAASGSFTTQADPLYTGGPGNDVFTGSAGSHRVAGGDGIDTLVLAQPREAFTLQRAAGVTSVVARDGASRFDLQSTERLKFSDLNLALDLDGHAGQAAKIIGAVFGAAAVANAEYVGIGLQLLDSGTSYETLMQMALKLVLGNNPSDQAVVGLLYRNVMGNAPSTAIESYFVGLLADHGLSQAALAVLAADTAENQAHIGLVGLADSGLPYLGA